MKIPCWRISPDPSGMYDDLIVPVGLDGDLRDLIDEASLDLEWIEPGPALEVRAVEVDLLNVLRLECGDCLLVDDPISVERLAETYGHDALEAAVSEIRSELEVVVRF